MQQIIDFSFHHWELILAFFVILFLLIGLELKNRITGFPQLSPQDAIFLINRNDAVIVDIREQTSFTNGHISGSLNIPLSELNEKQKQLEKYKDRPIIIVYATGQAFTKALQQLQNNGFLKLNSLDSGISSWQNAGLPLTKEN